MISFPLSICIPTYNRCGLLRELIQSIAQDPKSNQVELCISDNGSTDGTDTMVSQWASRLRIHYHRFDTNQGADANYLKVASMATGDFLWIIGSDDQVVADGISSVINFCQEYSNTGVFLFGRNEYDTNLVQFFRKTFWVQPELTEIRSFDFSESNQRVDYFRQVAELGGMFSYISSIVIRRDTWQNQTIDSSFIGTAYSHVYMILKGLLNSGWPMVRVVPYVPVNARLGNDSFFQSNRQRLMLDIDGYLQIAESLIPKSERTAFYTAFRSKEYIGYLANTLRDHYSAFSTRDCLSIATVCGLSSLFKNATEILTIYLQSAMPRLSRSGGN